MQTSDAVHADRRPAVTQENVGNVAHTIRTLALAHGITADQEPIDGFVEVAARIFENDAGLDLAERLLVKLGRAGIVTDEEAFALHVAYIRQQG